jgi:outer membrane protein OmpA-like peptidoglycan-associated protein
MAEDWLADVRKYAANADEAVVAAIVKYCGISLQSRDSSLVAMSDKKERENYLKKKLGLTHADADLDEAVVAVGQVMQADRTKNRVTVYYLLAEHFGLLSLFGGASGGASAAPLAAAGLAAAGMAATAMPTPDPVLDPIPAAAAPVPDTEPVAPASAAEPVAALSSYDDDDNEDSGVGGLGWLKWLLLAALLALLLFFLLRSCSGQEAAAPVAEPDAAAAGETADAADASNTAVAGTTTAEAEPAPPQGAGVVAGEIGGRPKLTVYFDTGKSAVTNDLATASTKLKDYMAKNPAAKIAVSGYNDPSGNAALNAELSKKRAQGVAKALEAAGIPATAINLEKPAATTDAAASAAEARRVEAVVKP